MIWGALGVLAFSFTLPATTAADRSFGGLTVGVGRSILPGILAIALFALRREPVLPPRHQYKRLALVSVGVVLGFPVCTSLALRSVSSVHGAVVTGLIPAATAGMAVALTGERPGRRYWAALTIGLLAVIGFAFQAGGGSLRPGDLLLLAAIALAGAGYAEGGALAREYGGWRVISWALVLTLPISVVLTTVAVAVRSPVHPSASAIGGIAYVSVVSMFLGFFAWYRGLASGGIARVGRLQLAQPACTLAWSAVLLHEHVTVATGIAAALVLATVAIGRSAPAATSSASPSCPMSDPSHRTGRE
jgi:drug/metabolite transporter (DMT)-like permease